jgi:hypothetical protein
MQRDFNDNEVREAASITIRNFGVTGFPNNTIIDFEVVNAGKPVFGCRRLTCGATL